MTDTPATSKELAALHKKISSAMLRALEANARAEALLSEYSADLPEPVVDFLEELCNTNPALFQAVTKFLKDNDVTCQIEEDETTSALQQRLAKKKVRNVGNVAILEDE